MSKRLRKRVGDYELISILGEGAFGKVWKAKSLLTNEEVAVKVLSKEMIQKDSMGAQIKKEMSILKLIRHPHIVEIHEVLSSKSKIYMVQGLVEGGEIFDRIVDSQKFSEKTARFFFQQLCVGIEYCHRQGVCHRDLKPENLLYDKDDNLKITDFGLSALLEKSRDGRARRLRTACGTPNYVAPEVVSNHGYDGVKSDTWSLGVVLYVFCAGFLPYDEEDMPRLFKKIRKAEYQVPKWFSKQLIDLLQKLMCPDPKRRSTISDVICHPWWVKGGAYKEIKDSIQTKKKQETRPTFEHLPSSSRKKVIFASPLAKAEILSLLETNFNLISGFLSLQVNRESEQIKAEFDFGSGPLKVKASVKKVSERPLLSILVLKKVSGEEQCFRDLSSEIELTI